MEGKKNACALTELNFEVSTKALKSTPLYFKKNDISARLLQPPIIHFFLKRSFQRIRPESLSSLFLLCTMFTATASAFAVAMDRLLHSFRQHMHEPPVKLPISSFHFSNIFHNLPTSKTSRAPMAVNWNFYPKPPFNKLLNFNLKPPASTIPLTQNVIKDQTSRKVKLICNFGGKIMPRGRVGNLHYVGGQSRVIAVRRDTNIHEFYRKMEDANGGPVRICYQLPNQSLDILVSVHSVEDFENMMDETDYLSKASDSGSTKLRVFLFPPYDLKDISDRFHGATSNDCGPSHTNKTNQVFAYEAEKRGEGLINESLEHQSFPVHADVVGTRNLGNQHGTRNTGNQQQQHDVNTSDSYSLFSDQDPWRMFGF